MIETILAYIITFFLGIALTYLVNVIPKTYRNEKTERAAIMMILQNILTNLAFVCLDLGYIMDYQLENWCNMLGAYEKLGGDGYIHALDKKVKQLPVRTTDVLQFTKNVI